MNKILEDFLGEAAAKDREWNRRQWANGHAEPLEPIKVFRGDAYSDAPKRGAVIKNLMGSGEVTFDHGAPKTGKSFLILDCALAVAAGVEHWFGHRIKRSGQVLYLVQEGAGGFPLRLEAWSRFHGRPVPENFVWTPTRLRFVEDGTAGAAVEDVRRVAQLVAELECEAGEPVIMIIIDTAARVRAGADENSAKDMSMFLEACAVLQDQPSRPHVSVVAHDNASGTLRGSTAQHAGGDGFIHVERHGDTRTWQLETAKDDPEGEKHTFKLQTVELGIDEDGDLITSCVVVEVKGEASSGVSARTANLTAGQAIVLQCLGTALADHGQPAPPSHDIPAQARVVGLGQWEDAVLRYKIPDGEPDEGRPPGGKGKKPCKAKERYRFGRVAQALQQKGLVKHADGWCWLPSQLSQNIPK